MDIAINSVSRVIGSYQSQAKIADLVKQANVNVQQNQMDVVTISSQARQALAQHLQGGGVSKAESAPEENAPTENASAENTPARNTPAENAPMTNTYILDTFNPDDFTEL